MLGAARLVNVLGWKFSTSVMLTSFRRNSHGVSKDKINSMLDLMDTEREATLTNLLKGYSIMLVGWLHFYDIFRLDPPIECEPPESEPAKFHAQQQSKNFYAFDNQLYFRYINKIWTSSRFFWKWYLLLELLYPFLGYSFTPIVSMQHIPKPTTESVTMRNVEIQTTEITGLTYFSYLVNQLYLNIRLCSYSSGAFSGWFWRDVLRPSCGGLLCTST